MAYRRDLLDVRVVARPIDPPATSLAPARTQRPPAPPSMGARVAPEVILVKAGYRQVATRVREILFVEASRNHVRIHLESGAVLETRVPLVRLTRHLGAARFTRAHRSAIVNAEHVRAATALISGRVLLTLTGGATVIVARDRRRLVLAAIGFPTSHRG